MHGSFGQTTGMFHYGDPYQRILQDQSYQYPPSHHHHHSPTLSPHHHNGQKFPKLLFNIPNVLPYKEQKEKFESDDLFKKLARESEVRYTGFRDRPLHERQAKFQHCCREGSIELAQLSTGFSFFLNWNALDNGYRDPRTMSRVDYHSEGGKLKIHFDVPLIVNGVCVRWRGVLNVEKLDGVGALKFDEDSARIEDMAIQDKIEHYKHAFKDWEQQQRIISGSQIPAASSNLVNDVSETNPIGEASP